MRYFLSFLLALVLLQGQVMADQPTAENQNQEYKKLPVKYFAFTPTRDGGYRVALLLDREKSAKAMGVKDFDMLSIMDINKTILKGYIYIYKQPKGSNRSELVETIDIQKIKIAGTGDVFIGDKAPVMLDYGFVIKGINPKYFDRNFYIIKAEIESLVEDLGDIGIVVNLQQRTPIM